jgi:hypothetical protein
VADNGIGLAPDIEPTTSRSLGFRLVVALANQLGATLAVERGACPGAGQSGACPGAPTSGGGTRLRLTFAADPVTPA